MSDRFQRQPCFPDALASWSGKKALFFRNRGNHGDYLIELGSLEVFKALELDLTDQPDEAEVIFLNGGGAFASGYFDHGRAHLIDIARSYPDRPVVVLPSSVYSPPDSLHFLPELKDRLAPLIFFTRERESFDRIQELECPPCMQLHLNHDMAFYLEGSELLGKWRESSCRNHLLIVERLDLEQSTKGHALVNWATRWSHQLGRKWLRRVVRAANLGKLKRTPFYLQAKNAYRASHNGKFPSKTVYRDISHVRYNSFESFVETIAGAEYIATTRLHVAILGALLGKPVALQNRNLDYNKIEPVFRHSLAQRPRQTLLPGLKENDLIKVDAQARRRECLLSGKRHK